MPSGTLPGFTSITSQQVISTRIAKECMEAFEVISALTAEREVRSKAREAWFDCDLKALRDIERQLNVR